MNAIPNIDTDMANAVEEALTGNIVQFPSKAEDDAETMAKFMRNRAEHYERRIADRKKSVKANVAGIDQEIARLTAEKARLRANEKRDNESDKKLSSTCRDHLRALEAE